MKKLIILFLFILIPIFAYAGMVVGSGTTAVDVDYETNTGAYVGPGSAYGASWLGQYFNPATAHRIDYLNLYVLKSGTPGNITVYIYLADANHKPTGSVLATATVSANGWGTSMGWQKITLDTGYSLSASTEYVMVLSNAGGDASNYVQWGAGNNDYSKGTYMYSSNSGSTWTLGSANDLIFKEGQTGS
jgi:hypothetical protein